MAKTRWSIWTAAAEAIRPKHKARKPHSEPAKRVAPTWFERAHSEARCAFTDGRCAKHHVKGFHARKVA